MKRAVVKLFLEGEEDNPYFDMYLDSKSFNKVLDFLLKISLEKVDILPNVSEEKNGD